MDQKTILKSVIYEAKISQQLMQTLGHDFFQASLILWAAVCIHAKKKALAFNARGETNGHLAESMSLLAQSPVAVCFIPLHLRIWIVLGEAGSGVTVWETVSWHSLV